MVINRRSFLQSLLATAVMDPGRWLWVPGKKTMFVPPMRLDNFYTAGHDYRVVLLPGPCSGAQMNGFDFDV